MHLTFLPFRSILLQNAPNESWYPTTHLSAISVPVESGRKKKTSGEIEDWLMASFCNRDGVCD